MLVEALVRIGVAKISLIQGGIDLLPINVRRYVIGIIRAVFGAIKVIPHFLRPYPVLFPKRQYLRIELVTTAFPIVPHGLKLAPASPASLSCLSGKDIVLSGRSWANDDVF